MELKPIIQTGIYGSPILIGGLFFEKQPVVMTCVLVLGAILLSINLYSEFKTAEARRQFVGYGDLR